ncbi:MAG: histidine kinase N-terminal 7TM domain-containing protein [Chthoniobacterales bacterium]
MEFPWQLAVLYATACIALGLSALGRIYKRIPAANAFSLNYLCAVVWCVIYALDLQSSSFEEKLFLLQLRFFLLAPFPLIVVEMTYRFIYGRKLFTGWRLIAALIIPVVTSILALFINKNPIFQYDAWLDTSNPVALLRLTHGPWYLIYYVYSYILIIYSYLLIIFSMPHAAPWARKTRILFLIGRVIPLLLDMCYHFHLLGPAGMNYAPMGTGLTGLLVAFAVFGDRIGTLTHVARYALVEKLNDLLVVLDPQHRVVDLNSAASAAFGISVREAQNIPASEFLGGLPQVLSRLDSSQEESMEIIWKDQDYALSLTPIESDSRQRPALLLHFHNITRRKQAENAHLMAKQAAEEANEAKSRYLAVMSHEIRSPLNSVLGFMQLLEDTPLNKEQQEYLNHVLQSGSSLLSIINEILDYSKIEAGQIQLVEAPFDLREELDILCGGMHAEAVRKGIKLSWSVHPDLCAVAIGDRARLLQVLRNLISNAIKFTAKGEVKVDVRSRETDSADDYKNCTLVFTVTDTGIGISANEIARLFQPFSQANKLTQLQYGGTGLGLTITRRLSELMGGGVSVQSAPGEGSTFTCMLKLRVGSTDALKTSLPMVNPEGDIPPFRILVTDDLMANRRLLQLMLTRMNHQVELAEDGYACLAAMEKKKFDIVFMDIEMLGMDGFETTHQLRLKEQRLGTLRPVYIIALTAHASTDIREQCYAAQMDDYLSKPITVSALGAALRNANQRRISYPSNT